MTRSNENCKKSENQSIPLLILTDASVSDVWVVTINSIHIYSNLYTYMEIEEKLSSYISVVPKMIPVAVQ